jgi:hypothetical protein
MTQSLEGFEPADQYAGSRLVAPLDQARLKSKRRLIAAIARFSRSMHEQGFNHRDFYLCHIFVRDLAEGENDLRIIDLQRVDHRAVCRGRWVNKDLAALHYSSLGLPLSDRDRLRSSCVWARLQGAARATMPASADIAKIPRFIARHDAKFRGCDGQSVAGPHWLSRAIKNGHARGGNVDNRSRLATVIFTTVGTWIATVRC